MADANREEETVKARRVTIDLTPAAAAEVDRLRKVTGLTTADVFRHALSLLRIYVDAKAEGKELELTPSTAEGRTIRIELPLQISRAAG